MKSTTKSFTSSLNLSFLSFILIPLTFALFSLSSCGDSNNDDARVRKLSLSDRTIQVREGSLSSSY